MLVNDDALASIYWGWGCPSLSSFGRLGIGEGTIIVDTEGWVAGIVGVVPMVAVHDDARADGRYHCRHR